MELDTYLSNKFKQTKKGPPHEKAAAVDCIIALLGDHKTYNYTYWLRMVGTASYATVLGMVKHASELPKGYSRGGYLTNQLKPYAIKKTTRAN